MLYTQDILIHCSDLYTVLTECMLGRNKQVYTDVYYSNTVLSSNSTSMM